MTLDPQAFDHVIYALRTGAVTEARRREVLRALFWAFIEGTPKALNDQRTGEAFAVWCDLDADRSKEERQQQREKIRALLAVNPRKTPRTARF